MTDLPKSVWSGTFRLLGVDLKCHVLDNGQRIIEADSIAQLFDSMQSPYADLEDEQEHLAAFARWRHGK